MKDSSFFEALFTFVIEAIADGTRAAFSALPEGLRRNLRWLFRVLLFLCAWMVAAVVIGSFLNTFGDTGKFGLWVWSLGAPPVTGCLIYRFRGTLLRAEPLLRWALLKLVAWFGGAVLVGSILGYLGYREPYGVFAISLILPLLAGALIWRFCQNRDRPTDL